MTRLFTRRALPLIAIATLSMAIVVVRGWGVVGKFGLDPHARLAYVSTKGVVPPSDAVPCEYLIWALTVDPPPVTWVPLPPPAPFLEPSRSFRVSRARAPPLV